MRAPIKAGVPVASLSTIQLSI
ncbi:hypothetical protein CFC21_065580, partial [Triticum aestivum]